MSNARQDKLRQLVNAAAEESVPVFSTRFPFAAEEFQKTPEMDKLLDTLRYSDAIYTLQEMVK